MTPKQANLFSVLVLRLRKHNHGVDVTTRRYREVEQLLEIRGINATIIGRHGGLELADKLVESSRRITELADYTSKSRPDMALSFCSPEAARVAYGLGIPHYALCDSPHAEAVCRLSIPLSKKLFAPRVVPRRAWAPYSIQPHDVIRYDALDPAVWIRAYAPGPDLRRFLGLDEEKPFVVLRTEEEYASYLLQKDKPKPASTNVVEIARSLSQLSVQIVVLPRYEMQVESLSRELAGVAFVPEMVIDAVGLLSRASVFVGAGGTMSAEAALLGVPTISCYRAEPTYVDRYLTRVGMVERILQADRITRRVRRFLKDSALKDRQRKKANRLLSKMEDPIRVVMSHLSLL